MNDPVLNRKLFRHKAQIIHKQIPKLQQGGAPWYGSAEGIRGAWQAGPGRHLWDFNRGAGFNTAMLANPLKKAKFAGATAMAAGKKALKYTGLPWAGKKWGKHVTQPIVRTVRKHPTAAKIAGGAKIGIGGALVGEGIYEGQKQARQGLSLIHI